MNSKDRRIANRLWQKVHKEEIDQILVVLQKPDSFSLSYIRSDGTLEMTQSRSSWFGERNMRSKKEWIAYLASRGVQLDL